MNFLRILSCSLLLFFGCQSFVARSPSGRADEGQGPQNKLQKDYFSGICTQGYSEEVNDEQQRIIDQTMSSREHRLWHYFWHATRNSWTELSPTQQKFFLKFDPRWQPVHLLEKPKNAPAADAKVYDPKVNGAGEDFLFMHHQMMSELFSNLASAGLRCISPWNELPNVNDPDWKIEGSEPPKDEKSFNKMQAWVAQFHSKDYLKGKKLSEVGYVLENSLHNNMHMRWATPEPPQGFGGRPEISVSSLKKGLKPFDDPRYNWLADPYSAHVNPVFWKLHGLVESVIFHWLEANDKKRIAMDCQGDSSCYTWKGQWMGAPPHSVSDIAKAQGPVTSKGFGKDENDTVARGAEQHHQHGEESDFSNQFSKALEQTVMEPEPPPPTRTPPKGVPRGTPQAPSKEVQAARLKDIDSAMKLLQKRAWMNRGQLSPKVLKKIDQLSARDQDDPAKFVELLEKSEEANQGRPKR